MPRSLRADDASGFYHALNRSNLRATIFHKQEDYAAFEKNLYEALGSLGRVHRMCRSFLDSDIHAIRFNIK